MDRTGLWVSQREAAETVMSTRRTRSHSSPPGAGVGRLSDSLCVLFQRQGGELAALLVVSPQSRQDAGPMAPASFAAWRASSPHAAS